jgi:hypothetical protein
LLVESAVHARVQLRLGGRVGARGPRRQALRELVDLLGERVVRRDDVDQAPDACLRCGHALAQHRHSGGAPSPGPGGHEHRRAAVRDETDIYEREQQVGGLRGQYQVARERERAADPDRRAVHRRDHRLGHPPDAGDDRVVALAQRGPDVGPPVARPGVEAGAQVGAGREAAARAGDRHGAHAVVAGRQLDRRQQVEPELLVPRVHALRAVERDAQLGAVGGAALE